MRDIPKLLLPAQKKQASYPCNFGSFIGFLPSYTKTARNRYVIVGAHFDHLGTINGTMYPGADSNASGTAALVTIAEMFHAMKKSGKVWNSNIIFIAFDGNGHAFSSLQI